MENINDVLKYKVLDVKENINLLNNSDLSDKDRETILKDLPKQAQELTDIVNKHFTEQEGNNNLYNELVNKLIEFKMFIESEQDNNNLSDAEFNFMLTMIITMHDMMFYTDTKYDTMQDIYFDFIKSLTSNIQEQTS